MDNFRDLISKETVLNLIQNKCNSSNTYMIDACELMDEIQSIPTVSDIEDAKSKSIEAFNRLAEANPDVLEEVTMTVIKDGGME